MITFTCRCGASYTVPDDVVGRRTRCRKCAQSIQVPTLARAVQALARAQVAPARQKRALLVPLLIVSSLLFAGVLALVSIGFAFYVKAQNRTEAMRGEESHRAEAKEVRGKSQDKNKNPQKKTSKPLTEGELVTIQGRCYTDPDESPTQPPYLVFFIITRRGADPSAEHNFGVVMDHFMTIMTEKPLPPPPSGKGVADVNSAVCFVPLSRLPDYRLKLLRSIKKNNVVILRGTYRAGYPTILLDDCELVSLAANKADFPPLPADKDED